MACSVLVSPVFSFWSGVIGSYPLVSLKMSQAAQAALGTTDVSQLTVWYCPVIDLYHFIISHSLYRCTLYRCSLSLIKPQKRYDRLKYTNKTKSSPKLKRPSSHKYFLNPSPQKPAQNINGPSTLRWLDLV